MLDINEVPNISSKESEIFRVIVSSSLETYGFYLDQSLRDLVIEHGGDSSGSGAGLGFRDNDFEFLTHIEALSFIDAVQFNWPDVMISFYYTDYDRNEDFIFDVSLPSAELI